jgi:TPR repeat protein
LVALLQVSEHAFRKSFPLWEIELPIDPSTAFVSYSRGDCQFALRLAKDLKAKGAKVWMDTLDIRPGRKWEAEIEAAVHGCSRMLVILSPDSAASVNVHAEVALAIAEGKEIIPVLYRECKIPFRLLPFQYADFRTEYSVGIEELLPSLNGTHHSTINRVPTPPATPATAEELKHRSAVVHASLAERYKQAAAEQTRLEQQERERARSAERAGRELELQRIAAGQARPQREPQQYAAQKACPDQNVAERQAAEAKARPEEQGCQRIAPDPSHPLREFKPVLPLPPPKISFTPRIIVAGSFCAAILLGSIVYGAAVASHLKYSSFATQSSPPHVSMVQETHPEVASSSRPEPASPTYPAPVPQVDQKTTDAARSPGSSLSTPGSTSPSSRSSVPISGTGAHQLTEKSSAPPPRTTSGASTYVPARVRTPDGMSPKVTELYSKAQAGDTRAMDELGAAYHHGTGVAADDKQAVAWYRKAAESGNASGMYELGACHENGYGVTEDTAKAADWYRKAAVAGDPRGMSSLGRMYDNGLGVQIDYQQAVFWYRKAAEAGDVQGMCSLGVMYEDGLGVQKDLQQAISWYRKAADAGDATGMFYLGDTYEYGKGVSKSLQQALIWYRKAAEAGDARAMNKVGAMYEDGQGVQKDRQQAIVWYRKAAQVGNQMAKNNLKRLGDNP